MAGLAIRANGGANDGQDASEAAALRQIMEENDMTEEQARKELGLTVAPPSTPTVASGGGVAAPPSLPTLNRDARMGGTHDRLAELADQDGRQDVKALFAVYTQNRAKGAEAQFAESSADLEGWFRSFDQGAAAAFGLEQAP